MLENHCYCGSEKILSLCCEPYILGKSFPATPEQLMRSRYSAFVTRNVNYLLATLAIEKHKPNEKAKLTESIKGTKWLGLKVIATSPIESTNQMGTVEFVAFFEENGVQQLHERSRFIFRDDRWYYLDGEHLPSIKLGRNDSCFCGSGKKYKKCHQH